MKKFLFIYALAFSLIWVGYGLYSVITNQPSANLILGIGVAFSLTIFAASWFSYWLMGHYKNVDALARKILSKN
ncbi:hypothetical protein SAMN05216232_1113 [Virgibacillus subterraneus]|uniref:Uncharacterized protein n=3 Tax=Virgibacillus TaxID=84406 RepID=A0A1H0Z2I5_9BACI|nr:MULTISPECIES: hypothetical protein [Virgibacillus]MBP1950519.1 hypothetical protein [Virgibacillus litoralis]SDQ21665.1 hypothetical protein SAMN05216231_0990 [Virgibacillus salinus]SEP86035.1 hypothetical protein SAMN05216232_1113 [Virgibacillus subterraneus]